MDANVPMGGVPPPAVEIPAPATRPHRMGPGLLFLGVILLLGSAALEIAYAGTELYFRVFPTTNGLGADVGFALQALFGLGFGLMGLGILLVMLAAAPRSSVGRNYLVAGGAIAALGGVGFTVAETLLYYGLFFARGDIRQVESYSIAIPLCWSLVPVGLAIVFLGVLRGASIRPME